MAQRRLGLLRPLLTELNPERYIGLHKQLALRAAAAATAGLQRDTAVDLYAHYLRCFVDARLSGAPPFDSAGVTVVPMPGATPIDDEGEAGAYLSAHMLLAHAELRLGTAGSVAAARKLCARRLRWVLGARARFAPAAGVELQRAWFVEEAAVCTNMLQQLDKMEGLA